jgi:competence protein ComEC
MSKKLSRSLLSVAIIFALILNGCSTEIKSSNKSNTYVSESSSKKMALSGNFEEKLFVDFLDVGQGDCILVKTPGGKTMLIDAGPTDASDIVVSDLHKINVQKIDVAVSTHPHEDHIGGMNSVIDDFTIGRFYMPNATTTTTTFRNMSTTLSYKKIDTITAKTGTPINLDPSVSLEVLSPREDYYEDLNDYSIVIKLTYKKTSFLLTGDATELTEEEMIESGENLKSDVLKVGHHGSSTSTSENFLNLVSPEIAVISVGKDNDYGHPSAKTLDRLRAKNIEVFRTDEDGDVVVESDGNTVDVIG